MRHGVLIVDDCPVSRLIAREELRVLGFSTAEAANGTAALAALARESRDAVLMDCRMPGLDGYATTRELRRRERGTGRRTVVIGCTAHSSPAEKARCREAGMDGVLTKPLDPRALAAVLARAGLAPLGGETLGALARFGGRTGEDLVRQVMESFLAEGTRWLAEMRRALSAGDAAALAAAAHALSGAAAMLRAPALEQCCAALESSAQGGDVLPAAAGLVAAVAAAYGRVADEIRASAAKALFEGGPAVAQGAEGRLDPVGRVELAEKPGQMGAHGRLGDAQLPGDLAVRQPLGHQP